MKNYIVFDIGGSSIKWSIINSNGEFLKNGKEVISKTVCEFFSYLSNTINSNKEEFNLQGVALSAPGAVDTFTGTIGGSSAIPYIHGPNFKEILYKNTGLQISIENDANCAALGESWLGAAKGEKDCAFVICGTGIGGALVKDKKIHSGVHKHGGEFGYCLVDIDVKNKKFSTWSELGSTYVLAKNIAEEKGLNIDEFDGLKAFELYDKGDEVAIKAIDKFFTYMAIGIYNIQYTYDPEVIIIGGAISEREGFIEEIKVKIDEIMRASKVATITPVIRKCRYGNNANKLGALYNYLQEKYLL